MVQKDHRENIFHDGGVGGASGDRAKVGSDFGVCCREGLRGFLESMVVAGPLVETASYSMIAPRSVAGDRPRLRSSSL